MVCKLAQLTLGVLLKVVFRPWPEGRENVPRKGPAIIAGNHLSFADHFSGPLPLRRGQQPVGSHLPQPAQPDRNRLTSPHAKMIFTTCKIGARPFHT